MTSDIDMIRGLKAIARHVGFSLRQTQVLIGKGEIPTFRLGGSICARRSTIAAMLAERERAAQALTHPQSKSLRGRPAGTDTDPPRALKAVSNEKVRTTPTG